MIIVPQRRIWTRQPPGIARLIDQTYIRNGLILAEDAGITNNLSVKTGPRAMSNVSMERSALGAHYSFGSSLSYLHLGIPVFTNLDQGTCFLRFNTSIFESGRILIYEAASTYNNFLIQQPQTPSSALIVDVGSGIRTKLSTKTSWEVNTWYSIAVTFNINSAVRLYVNGILDSTHVAERTNSSVASTSISGYRFADGVTGQWANCKIATVRAFNKELLSRDIASLHANPWQIYKRKSRTIFLPDVGGVGGDSQLVVSDSSHGHSTDAITLSSASSLSVNDSAHGHAADASSVSSASSLSVADSAHAHAADQSNVYVGLTLTVNDATHAHAADSANVTSAATLIVADSTHAHAADQSNVFVGQSLVIADATHGHAADQVAIFSAISLTVNDSLHAHAADNAALATSLALTIADATHAHAADQSNVFAGAPLVVADATHAHSSDNVTLSASLGLTVADATHGHTADSVALYASQTLTVADSTHAHSADNVGLFIGTSLAINDAIHSHAAENVGLDLSTTLQINDCSHGHTADSQIMSAALTLLVSELLHAHLCDNVILRTPLGTLSELLARSQYIRQDRIEATTRIFDPGVFTRR